MLFLLFSAVPVEAVDSWPEVKSKHFIVKYELSKDKRLAEKILHRSERAYKRISSEIGYKRYTKFWTWDDRVKIVLFKDKKTFSRETGQPDWSRGYAARHSYLVNARAIVTYKQEKGFFEELLPHEISHLIVHDFVGFDKKVPMWFDEGIAQLPEEKRIPQADRIMRKFVSRGKYIPFDILMRYDIRWETDPLRVAIFYAQSLSIVNYLIKKYGSRSFGNLCSGFKSGKTMDEALKDAYSGIIHSMKDLEKRWLRYMKW